MIDIEAQYLDRIKMARKCLDSAESSVTHWKEQLRIATTEFQTWRFREGTKIHPSHDIRLSDSEHFDAICNRCGVTDQIIGALVNKCEGK